MNKQSKPPRWILPAVIPALLLRLGLLLELSRNTSILAALLFSFTIESLFSPSSPW